MLETNPGYSAEENGMLKLRLSYENHWCEEQFGKADDARKDWKAEGKESDGEWLDITG